MGSERKIDSDPIFPPFFLPGKEGLVRIGELADYHVPTVEDVVQIGDEIMVVVIEIDRQGRINLSRKAAMQRHLARNEEES